MNTEFGTPHPAPLKSLIMFRLRWFRVKAPKCVRFSLKISLYFLYFAKFNQNVLDHPIHGGGGVGGALGGALGALGGALGALGGALGPLGGALGALGGVLGALGGALGALGGALGALGGALGALGGALGALGGAL